MTRKYLGVICGNRIELDVSPGLADGVRVIIELESEPSFSWGEGIKRSAGSLANDDEFSKAMEQIQRDRRVN